jgi:hypothetical protein
MYMKTIIEEVAGAMLAKNGFPAVEGFEYTPEKGVKFLIALRNRDLLATPELCGRHYGETKLALGSAEVVLQFTVVSGHVSASKSVFPCRGFVSADANAAITKVLRKQAKVLEKTVKKITEICHQLHQAGATSTHIVREVAIGKIQMIITEEPCPEFSLGWFERPEIILDALMEGARYFNLRVAFYKEGHKVSEQLLEGMVENEPVTRGHYGQISKELITLAAMQARVRTFPYEVYHG